MALLAAPTFPQDDAQDDDGDVDGDNDDDGDGDGDDDDDGSPSRSNLPTSCLTFTSLLGSETKKCKSRTQGSWNSAKLTRISPSLWINQI